MTLPPNGALTISRLAVPNLISAGFDGVYHPSAAGSSCVSKINEDVGHEHC